MTRESMSISTCIAQWRLEGRAADLTPRSGGPRQQCAQPDQVVGRRGEGHDPIDQLAPPMAELAESADGLHPAEDLLDQFPFALTDGISRMPRRAPIDARAGGAASEGAWRGVRGVQPLGLTLKGIS